MNLNQKQCAACNSASHALTLHEEELLLGQVEGWKMDRATVHTLRKVFTFESFTQSIAFVNSIAELAEQQGHHPEIHINFRKVTIELFTHAIHGLSENDFIMALKINALPTARIQLRDSHQ